jgi:effector-binding domain-containing protein
METITTTTYDVKEIRWPEKTFITRRAKIAFEKLHTFFQESYGAIYGFIQQNGLPATEMPCAIYYSIDENKKETDLAAAVPVEGKIAEVKGFEKTVIPSSRVVTTTHYGSYETMHPAYRALEKYLTDHGLTKELIIEEYFSDPEKEKDPAKWKTNIYFIVK